MGYAEAISYSELAERFKPTSGPALHTAVLDARDPNSYLFVDQTNLFDPIDLEALDLQIQHLMSSVADYYNVPVDRQRAGIIYILDGYPEIGDEGWLLHPRDFSLLQGVSALQNGIILMSLGTGA